MELKNMKMKGALVASAGLASVIMSVSAQAAIIGGLEVVRVGCNADANACTLVLNEAIGPAACTSTNITWNGATASGKNAYAALLTARASGLTVRINFDDDNCNGRNPSLRAALLE